MGASEFTHIAKGKTAREAFTSARESAQYNCGHSGYTGTIAEKDTFVKIEVPEGQNAREYAKQLLEKDDERISDKWGPAGCIKVKEGEYLFFGWASS